LRKEATPLLAWCRFRAWGWWFGLLVANIIIRPKDEACLVVAIYDTSDTAQRLECHVYILFRR
jgi:hypothetical protein